MLEVRKVLGVLALAVAVPQAQAPVQRTALVSGVVVDGTTGEPLPNAVVGIAYPDSERNETVTARVMTDGRGRFAFGGLPAADRLTIDASHPGYLDGGIADGRRRPGAATARIRLAEDEWLRDLRIELWRPASVSGAVFDERGEPVVDVVVRSIAAIRVAGTDRLAAGPATTTDDRGRYRIGGLVPGRYYLSVPSMPGETPGRGRYPTPPPPAAGQRFAYPVTFYPNVDAVVRATPVDVAYGDTVDAVNIQLSPARVASVAGRVEWPAGSAASETRLRLVPSGLEQLGLGSEIGITSAAPDGSFRFADVPAGDYVIDMPPYQGEYSVTSGSTDQRLVGPSRWRPRGTRLDWVATAGPGVQSITEMAPMVPAEQKLWAREPVSVSGADVDGLVVPLRGTATLRGHVRFELDPSRPAPTQFGVILQAEPADGDITRGIPEGRPQRNDPTYAFEIGGLAAGRYLLRPLGTGTWLLKTVTWNGGDFTHAPFDASSARVFDDVMVVVTNARGTITGTVRDDRGAAVDGAAVVLFPADRNRWTNVGLTPPGVASAQSAPNGYFAFGNLPGGEYLLVAAPAGTDWTDRGFFDAAAPTAERLTLEWGQSVTRDLVMPGGGQP